MNDFDHEHINPPIEFETQEGNIESSALFEPDERLLERLNKDSYESPIPIYMSRACPVDAREDVRLFDEVQKRCREIFLAKRDEYGDHLEKTKLFPIYLEGALYEKCTRLILDLENGRIPSENTLIDLSNLAVMVRTEQLMRKSE